ncbi:MAG: hypothetical protein IPO92_11480 [Saprospiraceae bacterium]|nr:hypothetical protein [Saprospiraceae bacterium]
MQADEAVGTRTLTINALPTATINGAKEICTGGRVLSRQVAARYKWSTNETTASIVVTAATYTVTVTDAKGCSATANETLKINASPSDH